MPQTITSAAILGSRYTSGVQYRLFDGTTLGALTNATHLGGGVWRAVVELPDAGGEVRWFAQGVADPLGIDVVDAVPDLSSGLTYQQALILQKILNQLEADYVKADDRFIRYLKGTNTIILDKDVSFDPDQGYTITDRGTPDGSSLDGSDGFVYWS